MPAATKPSPVAQKSLELLQRYGVNAIHLIDYQPLLNGRHWLGYRLGSGDYEQRSVDFRTSEVFDVIPPNSCRLCGEPSNERRGFMSDHRACTQERERLRQERSEKRARRRNRYAG